jgi:hypothetical protein
MIADLIPLALLAAKPRDKLHPFLGEFSALNSWGFSEQDDLGMSLVIEINLNLCLTTFSDFPFKMVASSEAEIVDV